MSRFRLPLSALLTQVLGAYTTEFDRELAAAGHGDVSLALGSNVLRFLDDADGRRVGQIAERAGVTKQAISQHLPYLERIGHIEITPDPQDGRAKVVRLTAEGAAARDVARGLFGTIERRWVQRHGRDTVAALRDALERIAADLGSEA